MSCILYYSNQCEKSKHVLQSLTRGSAHKDVHFLCIDKRIKVANNWYIVLENGDKVVLPPQIDRVPALLLMTQGHKVLFGDAILHHIQPRIVVANNAATQNNGEPFPFSTGSGWRPIISVFWTRRATSCRLKGTVVCASCTTMQQLIFTTKLIHPPRTIRPTRLVPYHWNSCSKNATAISVPGEVVHSSSFSSSSSNSAIFSHLN